MGDISVRVLGAMERFTSAEASIGLSTGQADDNLFRIAHVASGPSDKLNPHETRDLDGVVGPSDQSLFQICIKYFLTPNSLICLVKHSLRVQFVHRTQIEHS